MILSLVIPVYNEKKTLPSTLVRLAAWLGKGKGRREVIFSDDGSTDGSVDMIRAVSDVTPGMRLLLGERNMGKGAAVRRGVLAAKGRYIIFTDCDLAYGMQAVRRLEMALASGEHALVVGSRALRSDGYNSYTALRRQASKLYIRLLKCLSGLRQTDSQCGIKGFTAEAAERIFSECRIDGFAFDLEVLVLADKYGISVGELPVSVISHDQSSSKVLLVRDMLRMLSDVRRIRRLHMRGVCGGV